MTVSGLGASQLPVVAAGTAPKRLRSSFLTMAALLASTSLCTTAAMAIDGTWVGGHPGDPNEWTEGANWSSNVAPNGTGTFTNNGALTSVQANGVVNLGAIVFTAAPNNAPAYTINVNDVFIVTGAGVSNNSTNTQTLNLASISLFENSASASAGTAAVTYVNTSNMLFFNTSTAGTAIVTNNSDLEFNDSSNAGTAQITNNAVLSFNNNASASGATIGNGVGTVISFFNNSSAGTATITNSGTLNFNNSTTANSANITGATGSATTFNGNATAGSSVITLQGTGTLAFNDSSTAGSSTINSALSGGSITFNNTSTAGTAHIVLKQANLVFNNSASAGSAIITMPDPTHAGNITFNNTSTAATSNITVVGSLNFLDASTAANATIVNNNGGTTTFGVPIAGVDTATAGNANITNNAGGTTLFTANTTAANAVITNNAGGSLQFGDSGAGASTATAGNSTINNNGGSVSFNALTTAGSATLTNNFGFVFFNDSASAGTASIDNAGSITFANSSTAANANILTEAGFFLLSFADTSTAGNATITVGGTSKVQFTDGASGGAARFILNSGSAFDMSGITSGGMTAGSIEGSGTVSLGGNALTVGGNNLSKTFSGVVADGGTFGGTGGSLIKTGTGTLVLSGTSTYTGATTVNAGVLQVDGSTATSSLTTVNAGGTLTGSGTVGATAVTGGILAPGTAASPFTPLTVQGNLIFTAASTYLIQVTPANAGRTNVSGSATLSGATVNAVFAPGSYVSRQYTILTSALGVNGTFNPTVVNNAKTLVTTLSYDANDVFLNVRLNFSVPGGLTANQQSVANALTGFFNATGGIPAVFAQLSPTGLTQASGELGTASQQTTFDAMGRFLGLLTDPFGGNPTSSSVGATPYAIADALSYAADGKARSSSERAAYAAMYTKAPPVSANDPRWNVWAAGFGGAESTSGNTSLGSNNMGSRIYGTAVGADYRFSPTTLLGVALAGGATNFNVEGSGFGRSDLFQAGAYLKHREGNAYINAALAYGWQDITTDRIVSIPELDRLHAEFHANAYSGRVEGGYRFATPWMGITPYAAGQFTTFDLPAYAEQVLSGPGNFALANGARSVTDPRSELGLRTDNSFASAGGVLTLRSRFAWAHDFDPNRIASATFQTLPGASFVVNGAAQAHDSALATLSAEMKWTNGWSAAATFEGEFSSVTQSYGGKALVRYTW
jgi:uncharacterized protein with beta-barrel porin domain